MGFSQFKKKKKKKKKYILACDRWHIPHSAVWTFLQNLWSLALPVLDWLCLGNIWTKGWMNQWINDGGDCWTAPATPGLLNLYILWVTI